MGALRHLKADEAEIRPICLDLPPIDKHAPAGAVGHRKAYHRICGYIYSAYDNPTVFELEVCGDRLIPKL